MLVVAAVVVAPFWIVRNDTILWPARVPRRTRRRWCSACERFPVDALVISDDPGLAWRSGHGPPGDFADPSFQRIEQGQHHRARRS